MHFRWTGSETNNCKGKIAKSGIAESNTYKTTTTACKKTILDMNVDTDLSHYICRILDDLLYSGGSYLIVYQSYFSQVPNGLP